MGRPYLPGDREYTVIPDQIEAGTYMLLAPLTGGDIEVTGVIPKHMEPLTAKLEEMGVAVEEGEEHIRVYMAEDHAFLPQVSGLCLIPASRLTFSLKRRLCFAWLKERGV